MGARVGRWLLKQVPRLIVVAVIGGFVYSMWRSEQAARQHQEAINAAEQAGRETLFARGNMGAMLDLCQKGWVNIGFSYQEPVALAWTRRGMTAFFLQGSDQNSLRVVRCDASGVSRGPRVSHPLHEQLPAEAPPKDEQEESGSAWLRAVSEVSSRSLDASEAAFELVQHPVTGRVLSRRWRAGAEGATATIEPADAPAFALLVEAGQLQPVGARLPALSALKRRDWTVETKRPSPSLRRHCRRERGSPSFGSSRTRSRCASSTRRLAARTSQRRRTATRASTSTASPTATGGTRATSPRSAVPPACRSRPFTSSS